MTDRRQADRTEENRIRLGSFTFRIRRHVDAVLGVIAGAGEQFVELELKSADAFLRGIDHGKRRVRDIDADTVAPDDSDAEKRFIHVPYPFILCAKP